MGLVDYSYEGFYARFDPTSQKDGALLMGADNIVGDDYEIVFKTEGERIVAWAKNRFGAEVGFFDISSSAGPCPGPRKKYSPGALKSPLLGCLMPEAYECSVTHLPNSDPQNPLPALNSTRQSWSV